MPTEQKPSTMFQIVGSVVFYFFISLSITFLNKFLLNSFQFPLFVTLFQLIFAIIFVSFVGFVGTFIPLFSLIPPFEFWPSKAVRIFPLTLVYVGMVATTNTTIGIVEISFLQIVRSLVIPFNIVFSYQLLGIRTSNKALMACLVVVVGFAIGSLGEINFSWPGFIYGVVSCLFCSLNSIYVKRTLPIVDFNEWKLLYYNTLMAIPLLSFFVYFMGEPEGIAASPLIDQHQFWAGMVFAALLGVGINLAFFWQIKFCTPVTSHVSGNTKSALQAILGILIFQNEVSFMNGVGLVLTIVGSMVYSKVKFDEMQAAKKKEAEKKS